MRQNVTLNAWYPADPCHSLPNQIQREQIHANTRSRPYLVLANILASGHRELPPIDISVQSHALEKLEMTFSNNIDIWSQCSLDGGRGMRGWGWGRYLRSVGTGEAELHDEDRLGGDDGVGRGVGRRGDRWVGAGLSCQHKAQEERGG